MSAYYVHWYLGSKTKKATTNQKKSNYDVRIYEARAKKIENISMQKLAKAYKRVIKSSYGFKNLQDSEKFLSYIDKLLSGNTFQSAVDDAFNIVNQVAPSLNLTDEEISEGLVKDKSGKITGFTSKLNESISKFQDFLNKIEIFINSDNGQSYLDFLQVNGTQLPGVNAAINTLGINKTVKILTKNKQMKAEHSIKEYSKTKEKLENLIDNLNSQTSTVSKGKTIDKQDNIISYIKKLFVAQSQIAGTIYETLANDTINLLIEAKLLKNLPQGIKVVKSMHTGTKSLSGKKNFKTATSDIVIDVNFAKFDMTIPVGISMKKSKFSTDTELSGVHLKQTNLGKLLEISQSTTQLIDNTDIQAFYNIMGNHGRHSSKSRRGGGGRPYYYYNNKEGSLSQYFHGLNRVFLIPAIAGSLTKEDLSTMFLVNKQMYSIYDLIVSSDSAYVGGITSAMQQRIRRKHKWYGSKEDNKADAAYRSKEIINTIKDEKIKMSLALKLNQLNRGAFRRKW